MRMKLLSFASMLLAANSSLAQDITWVGGAGTFSWSEPTNWNSNVVPGAGDTAIIPAAVGTRIIRVTGATPVTASVININGETFLEFRDTSSATSGVYNLAGYQASQPGAFSSAISFTNNSTASQGTFNIVGVNSVLNSFSDAALLFIGSSTAGQATIYNSNEALTSFAATSNAGQATIVNENQGMTIFHGTSSAGNATITNNAGGYTTFEAAADASNATIINNSGGVLDISNVTTTVNVGDLSGAGNIFLGSGTLSVGNLNQSGVISGVISDGRSQAMANYLPYDSSSLNTNLTGGSLVKTGQGTLTLTADNTYTGGTTLQGGILQISKNTSLGATSGDLNFAGGALNTTADFVLDRNVTVNGTDNILNVNSGTQLQMPGTISGTGNLNITGGGQTVVSADNSAFAGSVMLNAGNLDVNGNLGGALNVQNGATLSGNGAVGNTVIESGGMLTVGSLVGDVSSVGAGAFSVNGNLTNSGNISLSRNSAAAGSLLTINGNYDGLNGSVINLNTVLGDDNSLTDKMVITGNSSGTSAVFITNAGGRGAQSINGIEVINVAGQSDANFVQGGRIVAGIYDYTLVRGAGTLANNWYLTSQHQPDGNNNGNGNGNGNGGNNGSSGSNGAVLHVIRPEIGAYVSNLAAANTLFALRLHERLGETQYTDYLTGETHVTSMWLRQEGGHNRSKTESGQIKTQANRYVVQIGGDIAQWSSNNLARFHLGLMAGYGYQHSDSRSKYSGHNAKGKVDGYSVGLYGTWYANKQDKSGLYVDSWVQYAWFDNTVEGDDLTEEKYDSKGWQTSVETGYSFKLGESERVSYWLQPKAQLTWTSIKADTLYESNGTRVTGNRDNLSARVGLRAYLKGHSELDDTTGREFQPFIETNWLYNSRSIGVTMNDDSEHQAGTRNIGEMKVGIEAHLNRNINMWSTVGQQIGGKGYSDTQGTIGFKYSF